MPNFDIILTSWNRLDYLRRTVASLLISGAVSDCDRFIIVDNGSTEPGVLEFLHDLKKTYGVFLVLRPDNRGWGIAVNDALGLSRARYLLISNNDVEYQEGFHKRMFDIMQMTDRPYMAEGGHTTKGIGILGVWRHISHSLQEPGIHNELIDEMTDVPAVGWMLSKAAMQEVGMLPEHGPCLTKGGNGEDSKYVQMMKAAGYLVGVPPQDLGFHIDGY